jgi:mpaB/rubber oxygenase-like protein
MTPTRFTNLEAARARYGKLVDKLAPYLLRTDPLADDVVALFASLRPGLGRKMLDTALAQGIEAVPDAPAPLRRLFAQLDDVPFWVDWDRLNVAGATHRRCGMTGGIVLACCSLPLIYSSPAGNKPLVFSGRLVQRAPRRLGETARFAAATFMPGGMKRFAEGFQITVKVRLMHAQIRRLLDQSGRWDSAAWGAPINQVDMVRTNLLFSQAWLENLRKVGFQFSHEESESVMLLWRYSGYLLGIDPELLCATEEEGRRLADLTVITQGPPDRDARDLTRALIETAIPRVIHQEDQAWWFVPFCYALSRTLIGHELAEGLNYPRTSWGFTARLLTRAVIGPVEVGRRMVPGAHALAVRLGTRRIRRWIETDRAARRAEFQLPDDLAVGPAKPPMPDSPSV